MTMLMGRAAAKMGRRSSRALEELVQRYGRLIKSAIAKVARNHPAVSDDVEQRVVVSLWRQLEADVEIMHPATYIYRCAVREAVRAVRGEAARGALPLDEAVDAPEPRPGPERAVQNDELARTLAACVAALPTERRQAVSANLAGFSVEEIMTLHGWPYQKARNLIARGMADLRAALRAAGVADTGGVDE